MKLMSIFLIIALGGSVYAQTSEELKLQEFRQSQLNSIEKELKFVKKEISQIENNITQLQVRKTSNKTAIDGHNRYLQKLIFEEKILTGKMDDLKDKLNKGDDQGTNEPIKIIDDAEQARILTQIKSITQSLKENKNLKENQKPHPVITTDTKIMEEVDKLNHFEKEVQLIIDESSLRMISERFKRMRKDSPDYNETRLELDRLQEKVNIIQNSLLRTQGGQK